MKIAICPGSFDPVTKGHVDILERSSKLFDKVIAVVLVNPTKTPTFTTEERVDIINAVYQDNDKIEVAVFEGMLVDFMKEKGIKFTVRGLRDVDDYKYETTMARYNQDMYEEVVTLFIPTPANLSYVSSSAMRNIINLGADFNEYVPEKAIVKIKELIKNK
jgi:pantetheine-phosphate adenylyltransferase